MKTYPKTIFELKHGSNRNPDTIRYFGPTHLSDACTRFAEAVQAMDKDKETTAGYATISRLPDSIYPDGLGLVAWTKTSDERETEAGALSPNDL